ncbi:hypothetical protein PCORN_15411 [Listeria cornellensis FSL F6-0969]|uniref:Uncharacterized protein n=1 Tax=Listeria cornellensis FSL F6-0969 TaxID=1265820 RepID=W7BJF5_9LIST|nr:hypothetical protein PCORN_15411 [Listeria cornellensis FSL F6-0969]
MEAGELRILVYVMTESRERVVSSTMQEVKRSKYCVAEPEVRRTGWMRALVASLYRVSNYFETLPQGGLLAEIDLF